jgi:hypothetical protein
MPRNDSGETMNPETISHLVDVVTDLEKATKNLSTEELKAYEEAQRSVVEARSRAETHQGHIRVL